MYFAIHALDRADAGGLRAETRSSHREYVNGFDVIFGGPLLDEAGSMCGSLLVVDLPSIEAAREFADGDPYVVAGLFARSSVTGFDLLVGPT
ncbi:MAG TPA: hypothetical protein DDZ64_12285 [Acidimicrobiaceae bacterium]|nr:hypothetical protein [Acidimicrobiaceae bacterium]